MARLRGAAHPGSACCCNGGCWSADYQRQMELISIELITPENTAGQRPPPEIAKARSRLVIESLLANLKQQMRLNHHLAKHPPGSCNGSRSRSSP